MMIEDEASDSNGRKEMKVKVPTEYQLKLHSMKVLTGKQISTAVTEAIELWFEEQDAMPDEVEEEPEDAQ